MQGRTVVITGASSGIGLATARAFAGRGANIVLVARGLARLQQAARQCEELGGQALAVAGDVTDPGRMRDVVAVAVSQFGGVDVWVNNAGTSLWGPFQDIPMDVQARLIQVDLLGAMHGAYAVVPHFLARGGHGTIINVVSIGGRIPLPFSAAYSAAKYGLAGFTDALRFELAAHSQIHVCGVYPAYVDTPTAVNSGNYTGRTLRPVPPVVPPERVAETIVGVALRPRRVRRVGALNALTLAQLIAPDTTGRVVGRLARWFLLTRGAPAEPDQGGLGHPHLTDVQVRGGWGSHSAAEHAAPRPARWPRQQQLPRSTSAADTSMLAVPLYVRGGDLEALNWSVSRPLPALLERYRPRSWNRFWNRFRSSQVDASMCRSGALLLSLA